jgi:energy-coupling factor transport system substrate-specific component
MDSKHWPLVWALVPVAALGGFLPGMVTAVLTSAGMELVVAADGAAGTSMPFVVCELATACIVAGAVRFGHFRTVPDLVLVVVAVTLANSVLGALVGTLFFGGLTLHNSDFLLAGLMLGGQQLFEASFWARVPLNLVDKALAVGAAFGVACTLTIPRRTK